MQHTFLLLQDQPAIGLGALRQLTCQQACLLEEVLSCDEAAIVCRAVSHRDASHPLRADGIYELVATASAFGSAGIFVVGLFGLFSGAR